MLGRISRSTGRQAAMRCGSAAPDRAAHVLPSGLPRTCSIIDHPDQFPHSHILPPVQPPTAPSSEPGDGPEQVLTAPQQALPGSLRQILGDQHGATRANSGG